VSEQNESAASDERRAACVAQLIDARRSRRTLESLVHPPESDEEAYLIQRAATAGMGSDIVGWKIGATSSFAQRFLGCAGPFSGPILAGDVFETHVVLAADRLLNPMIEPEIAVVLGSDLDATTGTITAATARAAVAEVRPAIEVVGGCFPDITSCGYRSVIADRGANVGLVLGDAVDGWSDIDLAAVPIALLRNDREIGSGVGADALGGPMHALAWLANHLGERGLALTAGQVVTTGTCGGVTPIAVGDRGVATHGPLGGVELSYR